MNNLMIRGAGGSSEASSGISEEPDNLSSVSSARFIDLISEGPIVGLVNGPASIFLDGVSLNTLISSDGITPYTYDDSSKGTQTQGVIPGFAGTQSEVSVGLKILFTNNKVIRSVTDSDADAARFTVAVQGLTTSGADGKISGNQVTFKLFKRRTAGAWVECHDGVIVGKTTSRFQRTIEVPLSDLGAGPYEIAVQRTTVDSVSALSANDLYWDSYTVVNYEQFRYPNSALIAMTVDARYFSNVPQRMYHVRGMIVQVPTNYDPVTRIYATTGPGTTAGAWDGTFKLAYTDNPAWCYYDICTNKRYGLGDKIVERVVTGPGTYTDVVRLDKWSLYQIAKACDVMVPTGETSNDYSSGVKYTAITSHGKSLAGAGVVKASVEPRFRLNCVINTREKALKVLNQLTSVFWGMSYWSASTVTVTQDSMSPVTMIYSNANVEGGNFEYEGSSREQRMSVVLVSWNDPKEDFRQKVEYVEDRISIARYGVRSTEIVAFGCTSRAQARRLGLWLLYTQRTEMGMIRFRVGTDSALVVPGDVVQIMDNDYSGVRWGGRLLASTTTVINIDSPVTVTAGTYTLSVIAADGQLYTRTLTLTAGAKSSFTVTALPFAPTLGAMWTLANATVTPRLARVVTVRQDGMFHEITAVDHNPSKYAAIELGVGLEEYSYSSLSLDTIPKVVNLVAVESTYPAAASRDFVSRLEISWDRSTNPTVRGYVVAIAGSDKSYIEVPETSSSSYTLENAQPITYTVTVRCVNVMGRLGPAEKTTALVDGIDDRNPPTAPTPTVTIDGTNFIVTWGVPSYYEGGGHVRMDVYASATNNSASATLVGSAERGQLVFGAAPLSTRYVWLKNVAKNLLVSASFSGVASGSIPAIPVAATAVTLAAIGYTGDTNATNGAPAGTLVGGQAASMVANYALSVAKGLDQFDPFLAWNFDSTVEGWTTSGATLAISGSALRVDSTSADPIIISPAISVVGVTHFIIRARVMRKSGTTWEGVCYYANGAHSVSGSFYKSVPDPTVLGEWRVVEWDMSQLTVGGTDWVTNTTTLIRLDLGVNSADDFDIDWIAIGRCASINYSGQAASAQIAADAANALLTDISSDAKFTPVEKQQIKIEWDGIVAEKSGINAQATALSITTEQTTYDSAYTALSSYITPLLASLTTTSDITGATMRSTFSTFYSARQALLNKMTNTASTLASWSGVSSRPANLSTLTGTEAIRNDLIKNGRNLIVPFVQWNRVGGATVTAEIRSPDGVALRIPAASNNDGNNTPLMALPRNNDPYVVSFMAFCSTGTRSLSCDLFPDTLPQVDVTVTTTPTLFKAAWTLNHVDGDSCRLRFFAPTGTGDIYVYAVQLQYGNEYTPWVPANEAVVSATNPLTNTNKSLYGYVGDLAATQNQITYSATAPGSPVDGAIWVDLSVNPNVQRVRVGGAWVVASNLTNNTNQLTDGAGLGLTAAWSSVSSRPANLAALTGSESILNSSLSLGAIAGTLIAAQVPSAIISTDKLLVTGAGSSLWEDTNYLDPSAWQIANTALPGQAVITDGVTGATSMRATGSGAAARGSRRVPVVIGKTYRISAQVRRAAPATGTLYLRVERDNVQVSALNDVSIGIENVTVPAGVWTRYSGVWVATHAWASPVVYLNWSGSGGYMEAQDIRIEEKVGADLIVDGSISTPQLAAGAVTANIIAAEAVIASKIAVLPANICPDPDFLDQVYWTQYADPQAWYFETNTWPGTLRRVASCWEGNFGGSLLAAKTRYSASKPFSGAGDYVRVRARVINSSNRTFYIRAEFMGPGPYDYLDVCQITVAPGTGASIIASSQLLVPTNAAYVRFVLNLPAGASNFTGSCSVTDIALNIAASASLIVDGAVTADKVDVNLLKADNVISRGIIVRNASGNILLNAGGTGAATPPWVVNSAPLGGGLDLTTGLTPNNTMELRTLAAGTGITLGYTSTGAVQISTSAPNVLEVQLAADQSTTTVGITPTNMSLPLAANTTYWVRGALLVRSAAATTGHVVGCNVPTNATTVLRVVSQNDESTPQQRVLNLPSGGAGTVVFSAHFAALQASPTVFSSTSDAIVTFDAIVKVGSTAGVFELVFGSEVPGSSATIRAGSILTAQAMKAGVATASTLSGTPGYPGTVSASFSSGSSSTARATATISLSRDGTWRATRTGSADATGNWAATPTSSVGDQWEVSFVPTSGTLSANGATGWMPLTSSVGANVAATSFAASGSLNTKSCTINIQLRNVLTGAVSTSGSLTLYAEAFSNSSGIIP